MSTNLRLSIHKKFSEILKNKEAFDISSISKQLKLKFTEPSKKFLFTIPVKSQYYDIHEDVPNLLNIQPDNLLEKIEISQDDKEINFQLCKDYFVKGLLDSIRTKFILPEFMYQDPENILVEFSSPNIAKPFHVGHLRSTIIGNYVSNINKYFENDVIKINYMGDWGTQYGFVELGLSLGKISEESLKQDPLKVLCNAYVHANKLAENDSSIAEQAREIFNNLENGNENLLKKWKLFKTYTSEELNKTYSRLGITFDEYQWESNYNMNEICNIICEMQRLKLLVSDNEGRKVIKINDKKAVPIIKSDGSSLYITRDIAAAVDRFEKYSFDSMYYVVDNDQRNHFTNLINVLNAMEIPWANNLRHIRFGKIKGMSTRSGSFVLLDDILNEAKSIMKEKQLQSPTTKINLDDDDPSTDILGISAVIINDLKHRRVSDYNFNWDNALDIKGDTGVALQYTHCRLVNLEENCGATIASECIPSLLLEPEAENLIYVIGKFDEAVINSYHELEPCILVHYLFKLSHATNRALKVLRIKGQPSELANQRLLLMNTARQVLAQSMKILGLVPLQKM